MKYHLKNITLLTDGPKMPELVFSTSDGEKKAFWIGKRCHI